MVKKLIFSFSPQKSWEFQFLSKYLSNIQVWYPERWVKLCRVEFITSLLLTKILKKKCWPDPPPSPQKTRIPISLQIFYRYTSVIHRELGKIMYNWIDNVIYRLKLDSDQNGQKTNYLIFPKKSWEFQFLTKYLSYIYKCDTPRDG